MENYYKNNWDYEVDFEADCRQDFLTAIQDNDLVRLKLLVETLRGLSKLSDNGYSLLKEACKRNMTETVEFLLSKNCDVNRTDSFKKPPLYYAIISGNMKVVQLLLKKGARVNISDNNENTVLANLLNAIENAKDGILECFIDYGFPQYDSTKECTPLHLAAFWGDMEILEKFLAKEAAVDAKTLNGMTPTHFACYKGHFDIVERLITQGACVNELAKCGLKAVSILDLEYSSRYDSCSPLHIAIANEHVSLVKLLLDHGANVNAQYRQGETALYLASKNSYEMTKLLLSYCPDVNDFANKRALTDAIFKKRDINTVRCLLEYGFTVDPEYVKDKDFLIAVCELGCVKAMDNLIRHGLDVNTKLCRDFSLLHLAVINKKRDLCEYLLDCKANINVKNWENNSPFFCAVENGDVEISKLLLERGTDRTEDITEASNIAVCNPDLEMVEFIFENYGSINLNLADDLGRTSLHFTVLKNPYFSVPHKDSDSDDIVRAKIAKLLLTKGSHVDSTTRPNHGLFTTLIVAATKGYKNVVEVLLENHAKVNFQAGNGISALHAAVCHGRRGILDVIGRDNSILFNRSEKSCVDTDKTYTDIVELLLKYGSDCNLQEKSGLTALHLAVLHSNWEVIKMLLKSGCDINLKDQFGQTALHAACINDLNENFRFLLEYVISNPSIQSYVDLFNLKDVKGSTPLIIASLNGCRKIVETLLNSGVDVNSQDGNGATALHHAVEEDFVDIVELLIKYGIDFNLQDSNNRTALKLAVENENLEAIEMLIKAGCDYKFQDSSKRTILHLACERNEYRTVGVIVTSIRSVNDYSDRTFIDFLNIKNNDCLSAVMIASTKGSLEVVKILLNSGANVNSEDFSGETALHHAVRKNKCTMVGILLKFGSDINRTSEDGHTPLTFCCGQSKCFRIGKPHYRYSESMAIKILENHVTKLMAAGFYVCEKNARHMKHRITDRCVNTRYHKMKTISLDDCLHELDISKKCFPYGNISVYDTITASIDKLSKYLRNEELVEALDSYEYASQFPIYADVIFGRFKMAKRRKHLRNKFEKLYFNCVNCDFSRLPYVCIEEIISNISDDDLRAFTDAIGHLC